MSGGWAHTCAVPADGSAVCWGGNSCAPCGDGTQASSRLPVRIAGLPAFTQIAAGGGHICDLTAAGAVWCRGADTYGQTGRLL